MAHHIPWRYPRELETSGLLRDGSSVLVRPIKPSDRAALLAFSGRLSRETVYYRFFSPIPRLEESILRRFVEVDYVDRLALVALFDDQMIGVARYDRLPDSDMAEVAFTVEDAFHGRGVGSLLFDRLVDAARERHVRVFVADTLFDNRPMLSVFRDMGFAITRTTDAGVVHLTFPIDVTDESEARADARETTAVTSSLMPLFCPTSVAVIGASRRPHTVGWSLVEQLVIRGFAGPVFPVNPEGGEVAGLPAVRSLADVHGPVDLAVIATPASAVPAAVADCAAAGIKAIIVITAGFAETGDAGAAVQDDLARFVRGHGMRMVGPNCMGVVNTDPRVRLAATFAPVWPPAGKVAMSSQSGALGIAVLDHAAQLGLGISSFVSVGNKADVSSNDLLRWWEDDPATSVIILYLESFGNPRKFARIARRISARKPILAVKSGRSPAGGRAATSHTAALASSDVAVDALFRQAGVIRADTLSELFDVAALLANQPLAGGRRLGIVTNAGGPAILAADAADAAGLEIPELSPATAEALSRLMPDGGTLANPVDLRATVTVAQYEAALRLLLVEPGIDAVLALFIPPVPAESERVAAAVARAVADIPGRPVLACFLSAAGSPAILRDAGIPTYAFPEPAVRALARTVTYSEWRRRPAGLQPVLAGIDSERAHRLVDDSTSGWLGSVEVAELLDCFGIRAVPQRVAASADEAVAAARHLGFPVAIKRDTRRSTALRPPGAVAVGLPDDTAVARVAADMEARFGPCEFVVQKVVDRGTDVRMGVTADPRFGPIVAFGLGGIDTDLYADVAFRITPLTDRDASDLVDAPRTIRLEGRGSRPPGDREAVEETLLRLSAMVEEIDELVEMDLNPVRVLLPGDGLYVLDAGVRVAR